MSEQRRTSRRLNYRLYSLLAAAFFCFAMAMIAALFLFDQTQSEHEKLRFETEAVAEPLKELQRTTQKTMSGLETWLLQKNLENPDDEKSPLWNQEQFDALETKLAQGAAKLPDGGYNQRYVKLFREKLPELKKHFDAAVALAPSLKELNEEKNYKEALAVYQKQCVPAAEAVETLTADWLKEQNQRLAYARTALEQKQDRFQNLVYIAILLFFIAVLGAGYYLIQILIRPLYAITPFVQSLADGESREPLLYDGDNELGRLAEDLNRLADNLQKAKEYSQKLAQGRFDVSEDYFDERDELGQALSQVQAKIQEYLDEETRRNWTIAGFSHFSDILRKTTDIKVLCDDLIVNLARYVKANLGALFLLNDDNPAEPFLEMAGSYAYNNQILARRHFKIGEGPVGQAAYSLETIHITQIPENYVLMASGLGEAPPSSLLIVPLISSNQLFGVIELASFNRFRPDEIEFVKKLGENIAAVVSNNKSAARTLKLLEQARLMGQELEKKSEALQKNAEVMKQAQTELEKTNEQLEAQMRKVNQSTIELSQSEKRFYTLLENASEIITIFEKDSSVRFQSPSVEKILGYKPEELSNFFRYVHHEDLFKVKDFFSRLTASPAAESSIEYRYQKRDGSLVFLESVGKNLLHDESIKGIVANTREISERIKSNLNAQRRQMFQSLSENSPDLIIRFDKSGKYIYINPAIERYTGNQPAFFIDNNIYNVGLLETERRFWENVIKAAADGHEKYRTEAVFPSTLGDRFMRVDAIPEFSADNRLETVLVIAHDITELKQAESKILAQNQNLESINADLALKKAQIEEINLDITQSIQYAKRIQESILPSTLAIEKVFKNFFVLFRPRDIVSGDFYWFSERGGKIFIAIVDCTGHGVPGAFMSLIGYNLLNQIVNEQGVYQPAAILDEMHQRLSRSLKQNERSTSKDGMDVAICCIELEKKLMQFAGANRPLYWWHQYELNVVRGDKHGIGSDDPPPFTNHTLHLETGDSIYLFSDGLTDQFGGEAGRKFTPRRLRELLIRNQHKQIAEQQKVIEKTMNEWQGEYSQVDDVVMIGIRF